MRITLSGGGVGGLVATHGLIATGREVAGSSMRGLPDAEPSGVATKLR